MLLRCLLPIDDKVLASWRADTLSTVQCGRRSVLITLSMSSGNDQHRRRHQGQSPSPPVTASESSTSSQYALARDDPASPSEELQTPSQSRVRQSTLDPNAPSFINNTASTPAALRPNAAPFQPAQPSAPAAALPRARLAADRRGPTQASPSGPSPSVPLPQLPSDVPSPRPTTYTPGTLIRVTRDIPPGLMAPTMPLRAGERFRVQPTSFPGYLTADRVDNGQRAVFSPGAMLYLEEVLPATSSEH